MFATLEDSCVSSLHGEICAPATMTYFISKRFIISFHLRFCTPLSEGGAVLVFMNELALRAKDGALDGWWVDIFTGGV